MIAKWIATGVCAATFLGLGLTIGNAMSEASERDAVRNRARNASWSFCEKMNDTGLIYICEPNYGETSVDVFVSTETGDVKAICRGAVNRFSGLKRGASGFSGSGWTLRVFKQGVYPAATCPLI